MFRSSASSAVSTTNLVTINSGSHKVSRLTIIIATTVSVVVIVIIVVIAISLVTIIWKKRSHSNSHVVVQMSTLDEHMHEMSHNASQARSYEGMQRYVHVHACTCMNWLFSGNKTSPQLHDKWFYEFPVYRAGPSRGYTTGNGKTTESPIVLENNVAYNCAHVYHDQLMQQHIYDTISECSLAGTV